jgi:hypothetical protein
MLHGLPPPPLECLAVAVYINTKCIYLVMFLLLRISKYKHKDPSHRNSLVIANMFYVVIRL